MNSQWPSGYPRLWDRDKVDGLLSAVVPSEVAAGGQPWAAWCSGRLLNLVRFVAEEFFVQPVFLPQQIADPAVERLLEDLQVAIGELTRSEDRRDLRTRLNVLQDSWHKLLASDQVTDCLLKSVGFKTSDQPMAEQWSTEVVGEEHRLGSRSREPQALDLPEVHEICGPLLDELSAFRAELTRRIGKPDSDLLELAVLIDQGFRPEVNVRTPSYPSPFGLLPPANPGEWIQILRQYEYREWTWKWVERPPDSNWRMRVSQEWRHQGWPPQELQALLASERAPGGASPDPTWIQDVDQWVFEQVGQTQAQARDPGGADVPLLTAQSPELPGGMERFPDGRECHGAAENPSNVGGPAAREEVPAPAEPDEIPESEWEKPLYKKVQLAPNYRAIRRVGRSATIQFQVEFDFRLFVFVIKKRGAYIRLAELRAEWTEFGGRDSSMVSDESIRERLRDLSKLIEPLRLEIKAVYKAKGYRLLELGADPQD